MSMNELRSITTFVRTAEFGSLSKAAAAQQISPQAASKALGQLEQHLGVRLFHRTTRSMSLTEEGQRFLEAVHPSLIGFQQALSAVRQTKDELAGPLRIVGPRTVLQSVIGPVMDEYCRLYPEVRLDVQLDDRIGNWVEDRIDVGFRLGNSPQEGLVARRLFPMQLIICAAPSYLRKYGIPQSLYELGAHRCSAFRRASDGRVVPWRARYPLLFPSDERRRTLASDRICMMRWSRCRSSFCVSVTLSWPQGRPAADLMASVIC